MKSHRTKIVLILFSTMALMSRTSFCNKSLIQDRVVCGTRSKKGEFPFIVGLLGSFEFEDHEINQMLCTGSIITSWWILTAGHCVSLPGKIFIKIEYLVGDNTIRISKLKDIEKVVLHEEFHTVQDGNKTITHNDIALLKTKDKIVFRKMVRPVCISSSQVMKGKCLTVGFGSTVHPSITLPYTNLDLHHAEMHYQPITLDWKLPYTFMFVTFYSCPSSGDSGGPLLCDNQQIGIANSVGGIPEMALVIYTKTGHFQNWIEQNIASKVFDKCSATNKSILPCLILLSCLKTIFTF